MIIVHTRTVGQRTYSFFEVDLVKRSAWHGKETDLKKCDQHE